MYLNPQTNINEKNHKDIEGLGPSGFRTLVLKNHATSKKFCR